MAQSGGIGFAFFDHGRAKELSFRYVVTTGNEACLEALDFADFILDEGKTDALLLLLEDVKSAETFRRVAEKALKAGKPIIVNKIGQSQAGVRAAASHTAALAGDVRRLPGDVPALRADRRPRLGEMVDIAAGFLAWGSRLPHGAPRRHLHGLGRWRRLDGGRLRRGGPRGAGARRRDAPAHRRASAGLRHIAEPGRRHRAGGRPRSATRAWPSWCVPSPTVDGIIVVMTARLPHNLERQREALARLAADDAEADPVWSYTLPAPQSVEILSEAGSAALHRHPQLRTHHAGMADYRALRERFLRPIEVAQRVHAG